MGLNWDQYLGEIKSEYLKKHWKIDECVITLYGFSYDFFKQNQKTEKHCVNQLVISYVCNRFQYENLYWVLVF